MDVQQLMHRLSYRNGPLNGDLREETFCDAPALAPDAQAIAAWAAIGRRMVAALPPVDAEAEASVDRAIAEQERGESRRPLRRRGEVQLSKASSDLQQTRR
jgi:hypothetical protein